MRVRIDDCDIFDSEDAEEYQQLQRLFIRAGLGQHELDLSNPERVLESKFWQLATSGLNRQEWEELLLRTSAATAFVPDPGPGNYAAVTRRAQEDAAAFLIAPRKAGEWAERPLRILLENKRDAILVHLAMHEVGSSRLQLALDEGWFHPEGCGGSGEVKTAVWEMRHKYDRFFAIVDSDRTEPRGEEGKVARLIRQKLKEKDPSREDMLPLHVLNRRELENYVPEVVWRMLVEADSHKGKPASRSSSKGVDHRTVLVYRWILRLIEAQQEDALKHGQDALDRVTVTLQKKAAHKVPSHFIRESLDEWLALGPDDRAVDDLKVRFGFGMAESAIEKLQDSNFDVSWLDAESRAELRELASKLEEWL